MIALYLLAAHLFGDFVLSNRWQAERKLDDWRVRLDHVVWYTMPFVVVALAVGTGPLAWYVFPAGVFVLHFLTDSHRFQATLGDRIAWERMTPSERADDVARGTIRDLPELGRMLVTTRPSLENAANMPVPPNPWAPMPLLIDQTLHVCQLAILGGLLLR